MTGVTLILVGESNDNLGRYGLRVVVARFNRTARARTDKACKTGEDVDRDEDAMTCVINMDDGYCTSALWVCSGIIFFGVLFNSIPSYI